MEKEEEAEEEEEEEGGKGEGLIESHRWQIVTLYEEAYLHHRTPLEKNVCVVTRATLTNTQTDDLFA